MKKILIPYTYNVNWIGGTYYIENLLSSMELDPRKKDYQLFIYTDKKSFEKLTSKFQLNLKHANYSFIQKVINKVSRYFVKSGFSFSKVAYDLVFPYNLNRMQKLSDNRICWIPDFQEKYYPSFFSQDELISRANVQDQIVFQEKNIIFSSKNAKNDFDKFYPGHTLETDVLNFASFFDESHFLTKSELQSKYEFAKCKYFLCSNQFWAHKNHKILLLAISLLQDTDFKFIFTGKEHDYRNEGFFDSLMTLVSELGLGDKTSFLGFIPREDQLSLMKYAHAVIQPSLFEGWSTVVEDAKALDKYLICSDLDVHREQIGDKGSFFERNSAEDLALKIQEVSSKEIVEVDYFYEDARLSFGKTFFDIAQRVIDPSECSRTENL
jgi:glycosyltransferase involved in cell wall biosynthesis